MIAADKRRIVQPLAISPPSDIVLDVARAVEASDLQAARAELVRRAGSVAGAVADAFSVEGSAFSRAGAAKAEEGAQPMRKFEAMVLQTFIQNMLPKDGATVFGKGISGDMWKSLMAEKIADVMSERGGIGIADRLLADRYTEGDKTKPIGPVSGVDSAERDQQASLSDALVQEFQRKLARTLATDTAALAAETKI